MLFLTMFLNATRNAPYCDLGFLVDKNSHMVVDFDNLELTAPTRELMTKLSEMIKESSTVFEKIMPRLEQALLHFNSAPPKVACLYTTDTQLGGIPLRVSAHQNHDVFFIRAHIIEENTLLFFTIADEQKVIKFFEIFPQKVALELLNHSIEKEAKLEVLYTSRVEEIQLICQRGASYKSFNAIMHSANQSALLNLECLMPRNITRQLADQIKIYIELIQVFQVSSANNSQTPNQFLDHAESILYNMHLIRLLYNLRKDTQTLLADRKLNHKYLWNNLSVCSKKAVLLDPILKSLMESLPGFRSILTTKDPLSVEMIANDAQKVHFKPRRRGCAKSQIWIGGLSQQQQHDLGIDTILGSEKDVDTINQYYKKTPRPAERFRQSFFVPPVPQEKVSATVRRAARNHFAKLSEELAQQQAKQAAAESAAALVTAPPSPLVPQKVEAQLLKDEAQRMAKMFSAFTEDEPVPAAIAAAVAATDQDSSSLEFIQDVQEIVTELRHSSRSITRAQQTRFFRILSKLEVSFTSCDGSAVKVRGPKGSIVIHSPHGADKENVLCPAALKKLLDFVLEQTL